MPKPNITYASYLLRFWQVQNDKHAVWVVSVQSTATGGLRRFPNVEALIEFLRSEFGRREPAAGEAMAQERAEMLQEPEQFSE